MSRDEADRSAQQVQQSQDHVSTQVGSEPLRLHEKFKPVGISAVTAAAHYTEKARKKPVQMG